MDEGRRRYADRSGYTAFAQPGNGQRIDFEAVPVANATFAVTGGDAQRLEFGASRSDLVTTRGEWFLVQRSLHVETVALDRWLVRGGGDSYTPHVADNGKLPAIAILERVRGDTSLALAELLDVQVAVVDADGAPAPSVLGIAPITASGFSGWRAVLATDVHGRLDVRAWLRACANGAMVVRCGDRRSAPLPFVAGTAVEVVLSSDR